MIGREKLIPQPAGPVGPDEFDRSNSIKSIICPTRHSPARFHALLTPPSDKSANIKTNADETVEDVLLNCQNEIDQVVSKSFNAVPKYRDIRIAVLNYLEMLRKQGIEDAITFLINELKTAGRIHRNSRLRDNLIFNTIPGIECCFRFSFDTNVFQFLKIYYSDAKRKTEKVWMNLCAVKGCFLIASSCDLFKCPLHSELTICDLILFYDTKNSDDAVYYPCRRVRNQTSPILATDSAFDSLHDGYYEIPMSIQNYFKLRGGENYVDFVPVHVGVYYGPPGRVLSLVHFNTLLVSINYNQIPV